MSMMLLLVWQLMPDPEIQKYDVYRGAFNLAMYAGFSYFAKTVGPKKQHKLIFLENGNFKRFLKVCGCNE